MSKESEALLYAYDKGYRINNEGYLFNPKNKQVKGSINAKKYCISKVTFNKESIILKFHRLQAYQKYGDEMFEKGIMVRHLNGNSLDNSWNNIAIGTQKDNSMDIPKEQRMLNIAKAIDTRRKFNHEEIFIDRENGMTYKEIVDKRNISKRSIARIMKKLLNYKNNQ